MKKPIISSILLLFFCFTIGFAPTVSAHSLEEVEKTASDEATPQLTIVPPSQPINLTLSPYSLQFDTKPGRQQSSEIKIRNNGTQDEPLRVTFATFSFDSKTQQIDLNTQTNEEYMQWISVDKPQFIVHPGEWESVTVIFSPPEHAALTYNYALIFSRITQENNSNDATQIAGAPAALVLTNVESPYATRQLELGSFSVPKVWIEFLPQHFVTNIINTGNIYAVPTGNIFIEGQGQKDIAVLPLNPEKRTILPNTNRILETTWEDGFPSYERVDEKQLEESQTDEKGQKTAVQFGKLKWDFSKADHFRFGKYTAHLLLVYDNGKRDELIEAYTSFWVIPWRICLTIFFTIVFVLIGIKTSGSTILRILGFRKRA